MATTSLNFDIYARDHASSTFDRFSRNVSSSNKAVSGLKSGLRTLAGAFVGLAIIQKTTEFLSDSVAEARESNKVGAQTVAVLKSTKGAAGLTADAVGDLANKLSLKAGIDDEAIQSGENLLLTFRNVRDEVGKGNDIFTQATKIGLDMSVAMGQDLKSSNIQLGKALNDPVKGITALTRVGVTFTEKQKAMIEGAVKHGDTLKAQKIILGELNKEFKGSAAAQADPADKAKVAWENLKEEIGLKLLPILDRLLVWFVNDALPAIQKFGSWLSEKVGPIISKVAGWFSDSSKKGGQMSSTFDKLVAAGKAVYNALYPIAVDIANFIKQHWPEISQTLSQTFSQLAETVQSFAAIITALWNRFGQTILTYALNTWKNLAQIIKGALQVIQGILDVFTGLLTGDWSKAWNGVKEIFRGATNVLKGMFKQWLNGMMLPLRLFKDMFGSAISNVWHAVQGAFVGGIGKTVSAVTEWPRKIVGAIGNLSKTLFGKAKELIDGFDVKQAAVDLWNWMRSVDTKITAAIGDLSHVLFDAGVQLIQGFVDGIGSMFDSVQNKLGDLTSSLTSWKGPPSKDSTLLHDNGRRVIQGFIDGINSKISDLRSTLQGVTSMVKGMFDSPLAGENVNTTLDIFREQHSEIGDATRLRNDIAKLKKKGLSPDKIAQLVETGNFTALHALANSSRAQVQRFERGQNRLERITGRSAGLINEDRRERLKELQEDRKKLAAALKQGVKEGVKEALREGLISQRRARDLIRGGA